MKLHFFSTALFILTGCVSNPALLKKRSEASEQSTVSSAMSGRDFPSIFQAWQKLTAPTTADSTTSLAQHDLVWQGISAWGLKCADSHSMGLCSSFSNESISDALQARARLKQINQHIILLAEIRHHDAANGYLPDGSNW